jgi:membrane-associated PAP2 superfamily phosphatase
MQGQPLDAGHLPLAWPHARTGPLPHPPVVDLRAYVAVHLLLVPLALVGLAWQLEYGALDMAISRLLIDPSTNDFVGRNSTWLEVLGHQAARGLPFLVGGIAFAAGLAGIGVEQLRRWTAILLVLGSAMLLGPLLVNLLRGLTTQHCPIDVLAFGGVVDYAADQSGPFWARAAQSAGRCLPSGHASGGYALVSLYFAGWAAGRPAWRWGGLAIGLGAGLVFSAVRILQGAHFASATLWSAAIAWTVCAALFLPLLSRQPKAAP